MAEYINRDAFIEQERAWYCKDCSMRKNSKGKTVYEIGEAPCRACDIGTMLDAVEDYPAADVVERKPLPEDVEELVKDLYTFSKDCTDSDMCRDCQLCFMCEDGWPPNAIAHLIETLSATHNAMTERKTGTWIHQSGGESEFDAGDFYICDKCGSEEWNDSNFCPNCGAKMEES